MSYHSELLKRMKALEEDHEPNGWPAVQMMDITALRQMIEGAKKLIKYKGSSVFLDEDRLLCTQDGYWLDGGFVGDLETAFYKAGAGKRKL